MSKHTPGPWQITTDFINVFNEDAIQIASLDSQGSPDIGVEESLANAYLISAAPEMLAVLKKVLPELDDPNLMWEVSDAIDKAEGRE
jgi:glycine cleavage system regulatory protein